MSQQKPHVRHCMRLAASSFHLVHFRLVQKFCLINYVDLELIKWFSFGSFDYIVLWCQ